MTGTITVVNRHTWKGSGIFIGRPSVFGNPYTHLPLADTQAKYQVATREEAIQRYRDSLPERWQTDEYFRRAVTSLTRDYLRGRDIVLACFCAPKPCHGDAIKEMVESLAFFGVVTLPGEYTDDEGDLPF